LIKSLDDTLEQIDQEIKILNEKLRKFSLPNSNVSSEHTTHYIVLLDNGKSMNESSI